MAFSSSGTGHHDWSGSRCCGCSRSHRGWWQSPGRCPSCSGWQWERDLSRNRSQSRKTQQSREQIYIQGPLKNNWVAVSRLANHLFSEPGAASLSHPLPGVDSSVDPDSGTVASTGAELGRGSKQGNEANPCANTWYQKSCFTNLQHVQGATLVALTNHNLADQAGILTHQHVLEAVDLKPSHTLWISFNPNTFLMELREQTLQRMAQVGSSSGWWRPRNCPGLLLPMAAQPVAITLNQEPLWCLAQ